ncbi:MAG: DegQ family serine endoprotease [Thermodesulfobacteriota bacterium]
MPTRRRCAVILQLVVCLAVAQGLTARPSAARGAPDSFADLAERLGPTVVNIYTTQTVRVPNTPYHFFFRDDQEMPELFRRFFGVPPQGHGGQPDRELKRNSLGSGVIVSEDGYILTNNHVVEDADEIHVKLSTQDDLEAEVVGRDPQTDVAVIRVKAGRSLPVAPLGDSDKLRVGEWVLAVGNPFGFEQTVTAGIVSAKGRTLGNERYEDFIQTDASINPGNSGGPLFDMEGRVVGINTAIFSRSGGNIGIGFAIPINMASHVMKQIKEHGRVVRGWLGVMIQQVTPELAKSLNLERPVGALISEVSPGSPAAEAGLKAGDVIVEFMDKPVDLMTSLPAMVAQTAIGARAKLVVLRDGERKAMTVTIGELKEERMAGGEAKAGDLGLAVQELTPELARSLGLPRGQEGLVVAGVEPGSPAAEAGIERGDLVVEVNRRPVADLASYKRLLSEARNREVILVLVIREGHSRFLVVPNPK